MADRHRHRWVEAPPSWRGGSRDTPKRSSNSTTSRAGVGGLITPTMETAVTGILQGHPHGAGRFDLPRGPWAPTTYDEATSLSTGLSSASSTSRSAARTRPASRRRSPSPSTGACRCSLVATSLRASHHLRVPSAVEKGIAGTLGAPWDPASPEGPNATGGACVRVVPSAGRESALARDVAPLCANSSSPSVVSTRLTRRHNEETRASGSYRDDSLGIADPLSPLQGECLHRAPGVVKSL